MEIAKMTTKGQLTVPKAVREDLDLAPGKKVLFVKRGNDWVVLGASQPRHGDTTPDKQDSNTPEGRKAVLDRMIHEIVPDYRAEQISDLSVAIQAAGKSPLEILLELQQGFKGVAESSGWTTEKDIVDYIKKLRHGEV